MSFWTVFLGILFTVTCVLLIIVVLLQKGRGGGLSAAFGGAGSAAFGTRTGDVFTWVTIVLTALFLLLAIGSNLRFRPTPGTVANPKFDQTGSIDGPTPVIIRCSTGGSKIAHTTNGKEPLEENAKGREVTAHVRPGQTLKARAFRKKWKPSGIVSVTYSKAVKAPESKPAGGSESKPSSQPK